VVWFQEAQRQVAVHEATNLCGSCGSKQAGVLLCVDDECIHAQAAAAAKRARTRTASPSKISAE